MVTKVELAERWRAKEEGQAGRQGSAAFGEQRRCRSFSVGVCAVFRGTEQWRVLRRNRVLAGLQDNLSDGVLCLLEGLLTQFPPLGTGDPISSLHLLHKTLVRE